MALDLMVKCLNHENGKPMSGYPPKKHWPSSKVSTTKPQTLYLDEFLSHDKPKSGYQPKKHWSSSKVSTTKAQTLYLDEFFSHDNRQSEIVYPPKKSPWKLINKPLDRPASSKSDAPPKSAYPPKKRRSPSKVPATKHKLSSKVDDPASFKPDAPWSL